MRRWTWFDSDSSCVIWVLLPTRLGSSDAFMGRQPPQLRKAAQDCDVYQEAGSFFHLSVHFKRPLGVSCNMDSMPIVVGELPQGEAYEAGVREGWVLCQVGTDESNMRSLGRSKQSSQ